MNYSEAEAYIQKLRSKQFAGFNDWRLPTLEEAMSLMEPAKNKDGLFINPIFDKRQKDCWSIDLEKSSDDAWEVEFDDGKVDTESKNHRNYVRAVR